VKFKLDENFGTRTQDIFRETGHDVHTVYQERLQGATDQKIYQVCQEEQRCLVTLDLDFANVFHFPPDKTNGIVVIRMPKNPSITTLKQLIRQFLHALEDMSVEKRLWIIEMGRIRIHQSKIGDDF
jgi:predicted nuclease of predicted toxin-antitoxin system